MADSTFRDSLRRRSGPATPRARVLVVDDDRTVREALRFELERRYEVELASSSRQGVAAMTTRPAAVILDIKMNGEDGFHAYEEIRKLDPLVPILFHSAYQDVKDPFDIINQYRPFGYVTKGGDLRQLLLQIERAVDYYQRHVADKAELTDKLKRMSSEVERLRELLKK